MVKGHRTIRLIIITLAWFNVFGLISDFAYRDWALFALNGLGAVAVFYLWGFKP